MANKPDLRGKTPEQKKAINYFTASGCSGLFAPKDAAYDEIVSTMIKKFNPRKKAIDKIGLDEDELKEIPPVHFSGYEYDDSEYIKRGNDGRWRASKFSETWLFFSATQVYMYNVVLDATSNVKKENTEEYFYKDVTNFSTASRTAEKDVYSGCGGENKKKETVEYTSFGLVVPGDKFYCSTTSSVNVEQAVSGMKAKLREKKM